MHNNLLVNVEFNLGVAVVAGCGLVYFGVILSQSTTQMNKYGEKKSPGPINGMMFIPLS